MADETKRPLKVFLCHASGDKPVVRELYKRLMAEGVDAWLDQEKLLPGQDWRVEIPRAVREADVVVICLSNKSITKEGYVQKEIRFALDSAEEKPEGTIFLIPARLEDCIVPERLDRWQWVDLFDENGFLKLLRSLKLRADKVGAAIEPTSDFDSDEERRRRLEQLYTEGLAAFYTEDWDNAVRRFQAILSEQPNHRNAAEKLAEAELQRNLAKLYAQATEAVRSGDWQVAIKTLEELSRKSASYKDVPQLLGNSRKQKQLRELYAEAKTLHAAQKWQAVLRVFEQISVIEPNYPDPDGLLTSAQKEVVELKRVNELNDLYSRGIRKMDEGQWYEARSLLEQVHKAQIGFLETERLLRKVEDEIRNIEELNQRNIHLNTLYEQVHDLVRSKNWRKALEKIEEIQKLDDHFVDTDGIFEKVQTELAREEQEAQQQRELGVLYAEAVSLLQAKKYQEALEKWNAIQAINPKYKDTARVKTIAKKKLDELAQPDVSHQQWRTTISDWFSSGASLSTDRVIPIERLLILAFVGVAIIHSIWNATANWLHLFDSNIVFGFLVVLLLSFYGIVVAVVYKNAVSSWRLPSSLILIIGWALGTGIAIIVGSYFAEGFRIVFILFTSLSSALATKWAKVSIGQSGIILILWALAWWGGQLLGDHLESVFNTGYTWAIADAIAILLGLLFTLGIQVEGSGEILKTAFFGALGFAAGNFIVDIAGSLIPSTSLGSILAFTVWGLIGGAILEVQSQNARRILFSAGMCGIGLLVGSFMAFVILPAVIGHSYPTNFPERYAVLRQICLGVGLGLALGSFIRRVSGIGILIVLGVGMYIFTVMLFSKEFFESSSIPDTVRGALIGLVLGYAYGYMRRAEPLGGEPLKAQRTMRGANLWGNILIGLVILSGLAVVIFMRSSRTLFFDDFNKPALRSVYGKFPLSNQGTPKYSFETLDGSSVLRLKNMLSDNQKIGWQISTVFDVYSTPFRLEIRFNTLRQSPSTSIDGFFEIWLFDANHSYSNDAVGLYAWNYGSDRTFLDRHFSFYDNTWYRLVIIGTKEQRYKASLYNDSLEKELIGSYLPYDPNIFKSGIKIGISQTMGEPGGAYPVDVAIDWIKLTLNPKP